MGENSLLPATASKATFGTFVAAHPVAMAVIGGVLIGVGAYYLGKSMANRANKEEAEEAAEPTAA